jgi:hypothetical protein
VAIVVIALVLLSAAVAWVANVEPLERGSTGFAIDDPVTKVHVHHIAALGVSGLV